MLCYLWFNFSLRLVGWSLLSIARSQQHNTYYLRVFLHTRTSRSATLHLLFLESLFKISSSCRLPNLHGNAGCSFANACLPLHVSQMMTRLCGLLIPWAPFHTARAAHAGGRCTCTLRWRDVQWLCGQWKPPPRAPSSITFSPHSFSHLHVRALSFDFMFVAAPASHRWCWLCFTKGRRKKIITESSRMFSCVICL